MGSLLSSKKREARVLVTATDHDRATLSLKLQRDKMKQACKRYEMNIEKDRDRACQLIKDRKKDRALLLLKRKRYQESMINRVSGYLDQIERMITELEIAQINQDVYEKLRLGNEALKSLNENISLDEVERVMEESQEAHEFQEELSSILTQNLSEEENELVEEEFEQMLSEQLPKVPETEIDNAAEAEARRAEKKKQKQQRIALEAI